MQTKNDLQSPNTHNESMEYTINRLELEKNELLQTIGSLIKEIDSLKSTDPICQQKQIIANLLNKREHISILPIMVPNPNASLASRIFGNEYLNGPTDIRHESFISQKNIELQLLDQYINGLRQIFDLLPTGVSRISIDTLYLDIRPIIDKIQECRHRLSLLIPETEYKEFLINHILTIKDIIDILNSKTTGTKQSECFPLSPYDQLLLWTDYLYSVEQEIHIQKRLLTHSLASIKLKPYTKINYFPTFQLFSQLHDTLKSVLITSQPINNIIYIQLDKTEPDYSFYYLESFDQSKRLWKLDPHLLQVTRDFKSSYIDKGIELFRKFYLDVFNDNNYRKNFEQQLQEKGIKRWRQFSILWENMQICSDEYLLGEIIRPIIKLHAQTHPIENIDQLSSKTDPAGVKNDFKSITERWSKGLSAQDEPSDDYVQECFNDCSEWDHDEATNRYHKRWEDMHRNK